MNMEKFFANAGTLITHNIQESGTFPRKVFTSVFIYTNGEARFNGAEWSFKLNKE
jgi:hypothetical protein